MKNGDELHVVFGSGPLGLAVARALCGKGSRVRLVNRSGRAAAPENVEVRAVNVFDADAMDDVCAGADVVYQCANPPYHRWPELFPPLQGVILEAAARAGARLVIADNVYAYGDTDGALITEDLPMRATTRKGRTRAMMARAALEAHSRGEVPVVIGRASDFFGPHVRMSAMGERVFAPALRGRPASLLGNVDVPHTYTYIDDFARALVILGGHQEAFGCAWHVPNAPAITTREFAGKVYDAIGLPPKLRTAGSGMLRIAGLVSSGAREMVEMLYEFKKPFVVDSSTFERRFGMAPTPLDSAIRETVAWYRANQA